MSDSTAISWTDSTWNPVTGCTKVSAGCDHCYAEGIARRFAGGKAFPNGFDVTLRPERLSQPQKWRTPRRVFVNSMSDLFHEGIPAKFIAEVFAVMAACPQHTFQVLTKRHGRMRSLLSSEEFHAAVASDCWPLQNVHIGVSVENQKWADIRIPALLAAPASVRWISAEPLLGHVDLRSGFNPLALGLDWVVVGGESGSGARPMHPQWARDIRDQCAVARVPFHFKQWGAWAPSGDGPEMRRASAKANGRLLDGVLHDAYPTPSESEA